MTKRHPLPETPVQIVAITATGGTFTLTYSGQETGPLAFDVAPAELQGALESLGRIGAGNVEVAGPDGGPFELRFGGELAGRNVAVVEPDDAAARGHGRGHDRGALALGVSGPRVGIRDRAGRATLVPEHRRDDNG